MVDVKASSQCSEAIVATPVFTKPNFRVYDIRIQHDIETKPLLADRPEHVIESIEVLASIGSLVLAPPVGYLLYE